MCDFSLWSALWGSSQSSGCDLEAFGADRSEVSQHACSSAGVKKKQISCWWSSEGQTLHIERYLTALLHAATAGGSIKRFPIRVSHDFSLFNFPCSPLLFLHLCESLSQLYLFISVWILFYIHFSLFLSCSPLFPTLCSSPSCLFSRQISSRPCPTHSQDICWQGHLLHFHLFSQSAVCMFLCIRERDGIGNGLTASPGWFNLDSMHHAELFGGWGFPVAYYRACRSTEAGILQVLW